MFCLFKVVLGFCRMLRKYIYEFCHINNAYRMQKSFQNTTFLSFLIQILFVSNCIFGSTYFICFLLKFFLTKTRLSIIIHKMVFRYVLYYSLHFLSSYEKVLHVLNYLIIRGLSHISVIYSTKFYLSTNLFYIKKTKLEYKTTVYNLNFQIHY